MKPAEGYDKLRGGYYTPNPISNFIADWAIRTPDDSVLEPSCGDGSFLSAVVQRLAKLGASAEHIKSHVVGIELDKIESQKAVRYRTTVICNDFFTYYNKNIEDKSKFDVIVGNPPFIRSQHFAEAYREIAFSLMKKHGFHPNRLTNIWLPFLILSCEALKRNGRIGMVIPAELFQVDYASEARQFLSVFFDKLTLVTFKQLVFENIQQEVILLLGERGCPKCGIKVLELTDASDLTSEGQVCLERSEFKHLDHGRDKWTKYYLSNEELDLLLQLNRDPRILDATDLFEVNVGLVSGENEFFVVNQSTVTDFNLKASVTPIISRSEQLKGVRLTRSDFDKLISSGKKVFFFSPGDFDASDLTKAQQKYIRKGESSGFNNNYKCRIRPRWYYVPQSWTPDAFLLRQAHKYPRMILNDTRALATDTLHKVRFLNGICGDHVVAAFLNIYTLALSETLGRSYGGGVLTFEPGEMRKFRIPMKKADRLDLKKIDAWQRNGEIEQILNYTDAVLLQDGLGLSNRQIKILHRIWDKMRGRRMIRKG